ncbi:IS3 family transposase [Metabacillus sp. GX 13764]|uniref:IS3 family transposase n=1 Tax=Metabacillus kandeliae TaxID=2900151 RepID=UPI001E384C94|nr:IS3 family transposase [Metabacillus kandeliae]MCD7036743.1 IS3 family transposase [Metabacillus kandeliae]
MSKTYFTEEQLRLLEANPNILHVGAQTITYHPDFKVKAVQEYRKGKTPYQIFAQHEFDMKIIGSDKPKKCLHRWRKTYQMYGEEGLRMERRGLGSTGRPSSREQTAEEKLKKAEARIKLLEAENDLLKKLGRTRKAGEEKEALTSAEKYALIEQTIRHHQLKNVTANFCRVLEVSRSGYYAWMKAVDYRSKQDEEDWKDYLLIKEIFQRKQQKVGALQIKMILEHEYQIVMNHKKIRRLMKLFHLRAVIRQASPYRKLQKATQEHKVCANLLERQFDQGEPRKVFLTDITYLSYGNGQTAYLSCVKDGATREIPAHHLSQNLKMELALKTLDKLALELNELVHPEGILHSDQGFHYTHPDFQEKVKKMELTQSMSRRGNCIDNASMESFFGTLKDWVEHKKCHTFQELKNEVNAFIYLYNTERYQWDLQKMTPVQYRDHLMAA